MQTNLIWGRGEDPNDTSGYGGAEVRLNNLNKLAGSLGLKAMWSFGSECEKGLQVYQEPVNTTACKRPFSLATFSHRCPCVPQYCAGIPPGTKGLAKNWSVAVQRLGDMLADKTHINGLWVSACFCDSLTTLPRQFCLTSACS